ncbi:MAG: hypothetical protein ACK5JH_06925 [Anaerocolumna sp.]
MHFDHSKRNYYRFPNANNMIDYVTEIPYYFPDKYTYNSENYGAVYPEFTNDKSHRESADFFS